MQHAFSDYDNERKQPSLSQRNIRSTQTQQLRDNESEEAVYRKVKNLSFVPSRLTIRYLVEHIRKWKKEKAS